MNGRSASENLLRNSVFTGVSNRTRMDPFRNECISRIVNDRPSPGRRSRNVYSAPLAFDRKAEEECSDMQTGLIVLAEKPIRNYLLKQGAGVGLASTRLMRNL